MGMVKKFLPVLVMILGFCTFFALQYGHDLSLTMAGTPPKDAKKIGQFEETLKNLKLTTTKKTEIDFSKIQEPIIILNFWASWCTPCLEEFPSLVKLKNQFKGKVFVLGINNDTEQPLQNIKKIEKKLNLNFESYSDPNSVITSKKFGITEIPFSLVFAQGKVIHLGDGKIDFESSELIEKIKSNLPTQ